MSYRKEGLKAWSGPQQGLPQMPFYTEKVPVCAWNIVSAQQMVTGIIITVSNRQDLQPMGIWGDSSALGRTLEVVTMEPWDGWGVTRRGSHVMRGK